MMLERMKTHKSLESQLNSSLQECQTFLDLCQRCDSLDELLLKMAVLDISIPDFKPIIDAEVWFEKHLFAFASQHTNDCNQMFCDLTNRVRLTILHEYGKTHVQNILKQYAARTQILSFHDTEYMFNVLSLIANSSSDNKTFVKMLMTCIDIADNNLTQKFKTIESRIMYKLT